uniref:Uncharacterized protein n=1 Tax=Rhizophora mucronata TaxID=61149 RepID=A0A2P2PD38_RHIMU
MCLRNIFHSCTNFSRRLQ